MRRVWVLVATGLLAVIAVLVGGDVANKLSLGGTEDPGSESCLLYTSDAADD